MIILYTLLNCLSIHLLYFTSFIFPHNDCRNDEQNADSCDAEKRSCRRFHKVFFRQALRNFKNHFLSLASSRSFLYLVRHPYEQKYFLLLFHHMSLYAHSGRQLNSFPHCGHRNHALFFNCFIKVPPHSTTSDGRW